MLNNSLGRLINAMLYQLGDGGDADYLEGLLDRYNLGVAPVAHRGIDEAEWRGEIYEDFTYIREEKYRRDALHDIRILEKGLIAAKGVVRIVNYDNIGTGFLCGENLIMTNNHVIPDHKLGQDSDFEFFYELDTDNHLNRNYVIAKAKKGGLFYTNADPAVDFTVIEIEKIPDNAQILMLLDTKPRRNDWISIIQHPNGEHKQIAMMDNLVSFANQHQLQYLTATQRGSSGAPVLGRSFEVMGLHRGTKLVPIAGGKRFLRNIGTNLQLILAELKDNAPRIYDRLNLRRG